MDTIYTIGPNGELYHWGIKGMKWGQRRYQNKDGSLTPAGRKRYADEEASLKAREKEIKNRERVKAKEAKLAAKKADLDAREEALNNPKKQDTDIKAEPPKIKKTGDMSDKELQDRVNRLRNEDSYRDLSKKLGYDTPVTELDFKIAEMKKQKEFLELQRDIKNLTPVEKSRGKQIADKIIDEVIVPSFVKAGKDTLTKYLTDSGTKAVMKALGEEASKVKADVEAAEKAKREAKQAKKQATKEARAKAKARAAAVEEQVRKAAEQAKREAKEAKQAEKQAAKEAREAEREERDKYTVEGKGTSHRDPDASYAKVKNDVFDSDNVYKDADGIYRYYESSPVTTLTTTRNTNSGSSWASRYENVYISGLLSAPKDDD